MAALTPVLQLQRAMGELDWDYQGAPVVLNREHILNVLCRHLTGEVDASAIELWANLIESREDIIFENGREKWVANAVFELANPLLTEPLTLRRVSELVGDGSK